VPDVRLHAETLDRGRWDPHGDPLLHGIASLIAAHRLREVSCLYAFIRFEPAPLANDEPEDVGLTVAGAPLACEPEWLPAVEQFGEGIFFRFRPEALAEWLERPALRRHAGQIAGGVAAWERARRERDLPAGRAGHWERTRPEYMMADSLGPVSA